MTDEALQRAVASQLVREPRSATGHGSGAIATGVDVRCRDGRVALRGEVASLAEKRRAVLRASRVDGVVAVDDELRVRPVPARTDEQIAQRLRDALVGDPYLQAHVPQLSWTVTDGVVVLMGALDALAKKRLAGLLAWWVAGVVDVQNAILVDPPEADNDEELTDNVRMALDKDKTLSSDRFAIHVKNGVVQLFGTARSFEERLAAEEDAWAIDGVHEVLNEIHVRPS